MKTYVIPDLHGEYDLLEKALAAIEENPPAKVIFLGDYIDRGPKSRQVIERLMAGPPEGWQWVCLAGNHDRWFAGIRRFGENWKEWYYNCGGKDTLQSYGADTFDIRVVPEDHARWLYSLPLYHAERGIVYVHAGVDPTLPLDEQSEATLTWKVHKPGDTLGYRGRMVVHGHEGRPDAPVILASRVNLDGRAYQTGRLCVGIFNNGLEDVMEIR